MMDNRVSCKITARYTLAACIAKHNSSSSVVTCVEVQFEKKAFTLCNIKMLWLLTLQTHNCIVVCCKTAIYLNSWWFKSTVNPKFKKSHHLATHLHVGVGVSQNSAVLTPIVATDLKVKKKSNTKHPIWILAASALSSGTCDSLILNTVLSQNVHCGEETRPRECTPNQRERDTAACVCREPCIGATSKRDTEMQLNMPMF